jgi:hypothetical protein
MAATAFKLVRTCQDSAELSGRLLRVPGGFLFVDNYHHLVDNLDAGIV